MINIEKLKENIKMVSNNVSSLNIDSIFIEQNNSIDKIEFKEEQLHELRSCAKLLVSMAIGLAIDKHFKVDNEELTLDTKVYPVIVAIVDIKNDMPHEVGTRFAHNDVEPFILSVFFQKVFNRNEILIKIEKIIKD